MPGVVVSVKKLEPDLPLVRFGGEGDDWRRAIVRQAWSLQK